MANTIKEQTKIINELIDTRLLITPNDGGVFRPWQYTDISISYRLNFGVKTFIFIFTLDGLKVNEWFGGKGIPPVYLLYSEERVLNLLLKLNINDVTEEKERTTFTNLKQKIILSLL